MPGPRPEALRGLQVTSLGVLFVLYALIPLNLICLAIIGRVLHFAYQLDLSLLLLLSLGRWGQADRSLHLWPREAAHEGFARVLVDCAG